MLSQAIIRAINFHAIAGLHHSTGEYRPHGVRVGTHEPPFHYRVQALMDDFVNVVNWRWQQHDSTNLAAYALWRLNHIHPFVNGNGRTARAVCYFILCVKAGGLLPGKTILPELLREKDARNSYIDALRCTDDDQGKGLAALGDLIRELLNKQIAAT